MADKDDKNRLAVVLLSMASEFLETPADMEIDNASEVDILAKFVEKVERDDHTRVQQCLEYTVPRYTDTVFQSHFHMSRESMEKLCQTLSHSENFIQKNYGGPH